MSGAFFFSLLSGLVPLKTIEVGKKTDGWVNNPRLQRISKKGNGVLGRHNRYVELATMDGYRAPGQRGFVAPIMNWMVGY